MGPSHKYSWRHAPQNATTLRDLLTLDGGKEKAPYRVALLVPMCGAAGMWAPSSIASAEVALRELNATSGICNRPVEMMVIDSAEEAQIPAEIVVSRLIAERRIDALVGMHISAVRKRVVKSVKGRVPFVYTPLYEGGENSPGVFTIGDTPARQLGPAIGYMSETYKLKKWALVGNNYVWPRVSHAFAKVQLQHQQASCVYEQYLPFSSNRLAETVEAVGRSGADAVLISLVGQDAVNFNREFGARNLHQKMFRLSCAIEENGLLASGADNLHRLFASASYFAGLNTPGNAAFREQYYNCHQDRAPTLNAIGQSTYEGMHFLEALVASRGGRWKDQRQGMARPVNYKSARHGVYLTNTQSRSPVYVARANGYVFDDLQLIS